MSKNESNGVELLSVKDLFEQDTEYVIPIYQRNYAWGTVEIEQLLQDICDAANIKTHENEGNSTSQDNYYLGSLIVDKRSDAKPASKQVFETIDGQQRHTTLSILLAYLKKKGAEHISFSESNLTFDSRPKSNQALKTIFSEAPSDVHTEPAIQAAYKIIGNFFDGKGLDTATSLSVFANYLLEKVKILRVEVPPKTDLNHYFEIMNNRGEQLEKHEVLKAKLMGSLDDAKEQHCFAMIWDACSDMNRYTQMGFDSSLRETIFGADWQSIPKSFEDIKKNIGKPTSQDGIALKELIEKKEYKSKDESKQQYREDRFGSIIDFPNFLLHVLKMMDKYEDTSLDDKKLLNAFPTHDDSLTGNEKKLFAEKFIFKLLEMRLLFDRYIIKPDSTEQKRVWALRKLSEKSGYTNTFSSDEKKVNEQKDSLKETVNNRIRMIQAMFHVTTPSHAYKNWLHDTFNIIKNLDNNNLDGNIFLTELERLSDQYFKKIVSNLDNSELEFKNVGEGVLHRGTHVQNFIFNRLDYLLWRKLLNKNSTLGTIKDDLKKDNLAKNFEFAVGRNSVEHYFPQTDPSGAREMNDVDRFGNLCLISPSSNSRLSNYSPADKKSFYCENNRIESLKQAIMMSYNNWNPKEVEGQKNIEDHEKQMIEILCETVAAETS